MLCPDDARVCRFNPTDTIPSTLLSPRCEGRSARCVQSAELRRQPCSSPRRAQRSSDLAARLYKNLTAASGVGAEEAQRVYLEDVGSWCPGVLGVGTVTMDDGEVVRVVTPDSEELALAR